MRRLDWDGQGIPMMKQLEGRLQLILVLKISSITALVTHLWKEEGLE